MSSCAPLCRYFDNALASWDILRNNKLAGNLKEMYIKHSSTQ